MKKQTAVEWLEQSLKLSDNVSEFDKWAFDKAKAMEKKNIKDSFVAGASMGEMFNNENRCYVSDAEKYLKETFKSE